MITEHGGGTVVMLVLKPDFSLLVPTTLETGNEEETVNTAQLYLIWSYKLTITVM